MKRKNKITLRKKAGAKCPDDTFAREKYPPHNLLIISKMCSANTHKAAIPVFAEHTLK